MKLMSQGTRSWLFGCHSPAHSILTTMAWHKLYGAWPEPWELVCIFIHDIGHVGTNFWDNIEEKNRHWQLGAEIAGYLFGNAGYKLCAGHDSNSGIPQSKLHKPDKYSRLLEPTWLLVLERIIEPEIRRAGGFRGIREFRKRLKKNIEIGDFSPTHDIFMEMSRKYSR